MHGAPSCERCRATGQGVANCCRCGHAGHPRATRAPTGRASYVTRLGRRRLPQAERVSAARGMHGWLQRLSAPENQDENEREDPSAPSAPPSAVQEQGARTEPGKGKKRTSVGGPADGTQRQQKRHKAAEHTEGGSRPQDLAPHLEQGPWSELSTPSPASRHTLQKGAAADPAPNPPHLRLRPGTGRGRGSRNGIAAASGTKTPTPGRGRKHTRAASGQPRKGGGGGQGDLSQPSALRRPTAAGKRPVQAGSPGLSTPRLGAIAQPQRAAFSLWASPDRQQ